MEGSLDQKTRLLKELDHLEKSFKAGIVNEEEFLKGKDRIEGKLRLFEKDMQEKEEKAQVINDLLTKKDGAHRKPAVRQPLSEKVHKEKISVAKVKKVVPKQYTRKYAPEPSSSSVSWYVALALLVLVGVFLISQWVNSGVILEYYFDATCSHCRDLYATLKSVQQERSFEVVYKNYPLDEQAFQAAEAYECAANQGKGSDYLNSLFSRPMVTPDVLKEVAQEIGLNEDLFKSCVELHATAQKVRDDIEEAQAKGVDRVPTLLISGQKIVGARKKEVVISILDQLR